MKIEDGLKKAGEVGSKIAAEAAETRDKIAEGAAKNPKRFVNIIAIVVVVLLGVSLLAYCTKARAHGVEHVIVIPKALPPAVAPPVVVPPVAAPAPSAPAQQSAAGGGGSQMLGLYAMAGVGVFFYAVICTNERRINPEGWFARNCKPWSE